MSDTESLTLSNPAVSIHPATVPAGISTHMSFARQRWQNGILSVLGAGGMSTSGVFLWSQIAATPELRLQMGVIGTLLVLGALAMVPQIVRDLWGQVTADQAGISVTPTMSGFRAAWSEIREWDVREQFYASTQVPVIRIWTQGRKEPYVIRGGYLSLQDIHRLRHILASSIR